MDYFIRQIEEEFKKLSWDDTYSFIEFTLNSIKNPHEKVDLEKRLNNIFKEEGAQYTIIDNIVTGLMAEVEFNEISKAQNSKNNSSIHISKSIEYFNKRPIPDYGNSIKESISAVEAISREITSDDSAILSDAVKKMDLHPALKEGIIKLYSWTSDEGGIMHALKGTTGNYGEPEARYLLVLCSVLVNFLNEKNNTKTN